MRCSLKPRRAVSVGHVCVVHHNPIGRNDYLVRELNSTNVTRIVALSREGVQEYLTPRDCRYYIRSKKYK